VGKISLWGASVEGDRKKYVRSLLFFHAMSIENSIFRLKKALEAKAKMVSFPQNGDEAIVIKMQRIDASYSVSVGIGTVVALNARHFDVNGKIYMDTFHKFEDNTLRIEPDAIKQNKGIQYYCAVFKPGMILARDEAIWNNRLNNLNDVVTLVENLGKEDLSSLLSDLGKV